MGIGYQAPWVMSWFIVALVAYVAPNWRHMQLITMVPSFLSCIVLYFVPESPKWLLATGKLEEVSVSGNLEANLQSADVAVRWNSFRMCPGKVI